MQTKNLKGLVLLTVILPLITFSNSWAFKVYDATLYSGKPENLSELGFEKLLMVYEGSLLNPDNKEVVDETRIRDFLKTITIPDSKLISIDIEHWAWNSSVSDEVVTSTVAKLNKVADIFKEELPKDVRIGFYSIPPVRDYWNAVKPTTDPGYISWQKTNDRLTDMKSHIDVIYPSLYTFYDGNDNDRTNWVKYAKSNIAEGRRVTDNKDAYPVLWFEYHSSNKTLGGQVIKDDFFRLQLNTVLESGAKGVVIWGGWGDNGRMVWGEEKMSWWNVTKKFIDSLKTVEIKNKNNRVIKQNTNLNFGKNVFYEISVSSANGKLVKRIKTVNNKLLNPENYMQNIKKSLSKNLNGLYIIQMKSKDLTLQKKIIIQ